MKLFYSKGACSLVPRIIINELGIKVEFESVNLKTKQTEKNYNFLEINPKGAVPTLVLDNGEVLTENVVIIQYLAEANNATSLFPDKSDFDHYRILEWLNYITTELHKSFGNLFNPNMPANVKDEITKPFIQSKFKYLNQRLNNREFLMGQNFTLPDAYLFVMINWAKSFHIDLSELNNVIRYYDALKERASIQEALGAEGLK